MANGNSIKALTLTQPWATLVAIGAKQIETRSWYTSYRGQLAIHAAKGFSKEDVSLVLQREPFKTTLREAGFPLFSLLPRGAIVAVCELTAVHRIPEQRKWLWKYDRGENGNTEVIHLPPSADALESAFGDYTPGRYAWILSEVRALDKPIPCKGALGLWDVPACDPMLEQQLRLC